MSLVSSVILLAYLAYAVPPGHGVPASGSCNFILYNYRIIEILNALFFGPAAELGLSGLVVKVSD